MKPSELSSLIRTIVAEEVKKQLPLVLSEMFVRRIVNESLDVAQEPVAARQVQPAKRQAGGKRSLAETLGVADDAPQQLNVRRQQEAPQMASREQLRERIRRTVLDDPEQNPMAYLYEGVTPIDDENAASSVSLGVDGAPDPRLGADGVNLDMLGFKGMPDFSAVVESTNDASRGPIQESEAMVMRRIEQQRARLDSMRVG